MQFTFIENIYTAGFYFIIMKILTDFRNALISGNPGGVDPGGIRGNSAGFADFCRRFLARKGGIGSLLHFRGKIQGEL